MTRKHNERIQELQQKVTNLNKQLASLHKASKMKNIISTGGSNGNNDNNSPLSFS
ncbi:hypothetical protein BLA29_013995 [Euroglyphus maynei]|uniref:Uncharacterized protein n=1 Tax=Euroglyphus maynei TaxID=6958 RepID=A0A1Y3BIY8_EURMA|nr:hypothetical protein BLA29_013995 [Euroglyphus maynei]